MHSADGGSVCLMYHQRHFKLLIHRQSVDLTGRKRICWQDLCCTPDKTVSERLLLNNKGFLLEFFGIYFVTNRWKCLLDHLHHLFAFSK